MKLLREERVVPRSFDINFRQKHDHRGQKAYPLSPIGKVEVLRSCRGHGRDAGLVGSTYIVNCQRVSFIER